MHAIASLTDLSVAYEQTTALAGLTLELRRGAVTALTGPNGSGKSTLLGVLAGTTPISSGALRWHDHDASPGRIAYVPQHARIPDSLPMTVSAVVRMGRWARGPRASESRSSLRTRRAADRELVQESLRELGLTELGRRPLSSLSGGQRQRVLLAQGIVQDTELLLLDEPTAGVDADSRSRIRACLGALADDGRTIVVASHDEQEIAAARDVVCLDRGHLVPGGPLGVLAH